MQSSETTPEQMQMLKDIAQANGLSLMTVSDGLCLGATSSGRVVALRYSETLERNVANMQRAFESTA